MPAAAVIPAPIAYIKVAAVKKLVVVLKSVSSGALNLCFYLSHLGIQPILVPGNALHRVSLAIGNFTLKKLECLKQAYWPEYSCME